ncbi:hypothetical protein RSOLAG1IB_09442 [Rhizoctonia solani AG-1 IB]|uniref:Ricin B lectin domain-containing protein n=1 Tax=Thanatephorus cucumeris (strain AG1-IB / isolate 7/3/14) TaxID=1108050 RepID=A0A0B7FTK8_THACB|nr:hypothetical protein RSOLAG1IB_09442 [Rhizoctonia solani AG-1 IB]
MAYGLSGAAVVDHPLSYVLYLYNLFSTMEDGLYEISHPHFGPIFIPTGAPKGFPVQTGIHGAIASTISIKNQGNNRYSLTPATAFPVPDRPAIGATNDVARVVILAAPGTAEYTEWEIDLNEGGAETYLIHTPRDSGNKYWNALGEDSQIELQNFDGNPFQEWKLKKL